MSASESAPRPSDHHIRRLSRFLVWGVSLAAMLQLPVVWWMWLFPVTSDLVTSPVPGNGFGGGDLSWFILPARLGAAGLASIGALITIYGFYHLRSLFREAARGAYFSGAAVTGFRQFALASLVGALWDPAEHALMGVYLTVANPNVPNALEISLGSGNLGAIGAALVFFLIAFILAEGRKRTEELELIL